MTPITIQSRQFKKDYRKLPDEIRKRFDERFYLFLNNPLNPILRKHYLHGKYNGCFSINITGDYRVIIQNGPVGFIFLRIGTHAQLYDK